MSDVGTYLGALGGLGGLVALLTVIVRWQSGLTGRASEELLSVVASLRAEVAALRAEGEKTQRELDATKVDLAAARDLERGLRHELTQHARQLAESRERIAQLERERREAREALADELLEAARMRRDLKPTG
jgi:chromosome segregation ATPase